MGRGVSGFQVILFHNTTACRLHRHYTVEDSCDSVSLPRGNSFSRGLTEAGVDANRQIRIDPVGQFPFGPTLPQTGCCRGSKPSSLQSAGCDPLVANRLTNTFDLIGAMTLERLSCCQGQKPDRRNNQPLPPRTNQFSSSFSLKSHFRLNSIHSISC